TNIRDLMAGRYGRKPANRCRLRPSSHKKASRGGPGSLVVTSARRRMNGCGRYSRARSGGRHQHGVDHMDHAVRLIDVGDRDHRGSALGVDDHDVLALALDGELLALDRLQSLAIL